MPEDQKNGPDAAAAEKAAAEKAAARALVVSRAILNRLNACAQGHATFAERFSGIKGATFDAATETWTLQNGWTKEVTRKLALEAPVSLRWYVRNGFAPADCGWREAIAAAQNAPGGAVRPSFHRVAA